MSLTAGSRIGPYEIVAPLGAGGMGEVFRARDTHLGRDVAIKALPPVVAGDPERVARFQREAQVLAALNHPNIAGIHGLEESGGAKFLVLEFVEGATLAEHLKAPLPLAEAMPMARQIIDALEAAHDKGIVHRDLKPANIMLTADGQVKLLDFGLARVVESDPAASTSNSPTLTFAATQVGVILGTAAYMSPEQAKGRVADKRSDVWAFGCVFYEMLTGKRVFDGEDVSDTLAAVLRADPDWSALPANLPGGIRALLQRCLERDRKLRIPDMAVVRFLLQDALIAPVTATTSVAAASGFSRARMGVIALAALLVGAGATATVAWLLARATPAPRAHVMRFDVVPAAGQTLGPTPTDRQIAVSPDGTHFAYVAGGSSSGGNLVVRALDRTEAQTLAGINTARSPFFSADAKWIGYFNGQLDLRKVSITGGPSISLCPLTGIPRGASWSSDDAIIFATTDASTGLLSVPAGGGVAKTLTTPDAAAGEGDHIAPFVLPDGRSVLFTIVPTAGPSTIAQLANAQVAVLDLRTGRHQTVIRGGSYAEFVEPGYLVYAAGGSLRAVRFDPSTYKVLSDPVPVVESVGTAIASGAAQYGVTRTGALVYIPGSMLTVLGGGSARSLVWIDRKGREEPLAGAPPRAYFNLRLSPDGTRVALDIRDQENDIWVWDLGRRTLTRLTFEPVADLFPVWTRDSRRLVFTSLRSGTANLYWQAADGTGAPERLTTAAHAQYPMSFSSDGRLLVNELMPKTNGDISLLLPDGKASPTPLINTPAAERTADVSPDGRWIAYESDESGTSEIYVRPFPDVNTGRWQVSIAGGTKPVWAPGGAELFYVDGNSFLMAVSIQTKAGFQAGNPIKLFEAKNIATLTSARFYDVTRDGRRFLMIKEPSPAASAQRSGPPPPTFVVVLNWVEELKARVGK